MVVVDTQAAGKVAVGKEAVAEPMLAAAVVGVLAAARGGVLGNNRAVAVAVRPPVRAAEIDHRPIARLRSASQTPAVVNRELLARSRGPVLHNRRLAPEQVRRWDRMRGEFSREAEELVPILAARSVNLGQTTAEARTATWEQGHD